MSNSTLATMVALFVVDPIKVDMADRLTVAQAPPAIMADVAACIRWAKPVIVERAAADPAWAAIAAKRLMFGMHRTEEVLKEIAPVCDSAVESARPYLERRSAS